MPTPNPDPTRRAVPLIFTLPNELLLKILDHLPTASSKSNYSRTNRHLYHLCLRPLYKHALTIKVPFLAYFKDPYRCPILVVQYTILAHHAHATLAHLLSAGLSVNKLFPVARKEQQHMTALMFAAQYGDVEMVKQLVAAGADAAAANGRGSTALHYCAFSYNVGQRGEVVGVLVAAGAAVDARDKRGCTPLHCAVGYRSLEVVEELLRRGAGCVLGVRSEAGRTPLDMLTVKPVRLSPEVKVGREGADGRIREILMAAGATE